MFRCVLEFIDIKGSLIFQMKWESATCSDLDSVGIRLKSAFQQPLPRIMLLKSEREEHKSYVSQGMKAD